MTTLTRSPNGVTTNSSNGIDFENMKKVGTLMSYKMDTVSPKVQSSKENLNTTPSSHVSLNSSSNGVSKGSPVNENLELVPKSERKTPQLPQNENGSFLKQKERNSTAESLKERPVHKVEPILSCSFGASTDHSRHSANTEGTDEIHRLKEENEALHAQVKLQSEVNGELKRLLVASVGDDLQYRFERLVRDRARFNMEIDSSNEKMCELAEEIEKLHIQCDVWRSKFLASRVTIDELASWKAILFQQHREQESAIKLLLQELQSIKEAVFKSNLCLNQLEYAFEDRKAIPLPRPMNVIEASKENFLISQRLRKRLLGDLSVPYPAIAEVATMAEDTSIETLGSLPIPMREEDLDSTSVEALLTRMRSSRTMHIERFHPLTRSDKLTVNCCRQCKGELRVI